MLVKLGLCLFRHTLPGTHNTRRGRYSNKLPVHLWTPSGMAILAILKVGSKFGVLDCSGEGGGGGSEVT